MDLAKSKFLLRKEIKSKLGNISETDMVGASVEARKKIVSFLKEFTRYPHLKVASFAAYTKEIELTPLVREMPEISWFFPRCESKYQMEFYRVTDPEVDFEPGYMGIREPKAELEKISPDQLDIILTPGLAFSRHGHRLGKGGGFYDAYFPRTKAMKIGIALAMQVFPSIPMDSHDHFLDDLIVADEC